MTYALFSHLWLQLRPYTDSDFNLLWFVRLSLSSCRPEIELSRNSLLRLISSIFFLLSEHFLMKALGRASGLRLRLFIDGLRNGQRCRRLIAAFALRCTLFLWRNSNCIPSFSWCSGHLLGRLFLRTPPLVELDPLVHVNKPFLYYYIIIK